MDEGLLSKLIDTNATPVVHGATDFNSQLVALKALFMCEMYELKRKINRLRESINKRDQNAGENNFYQDYKIKIYYLEQQNSFLKQEFLLNQNTIDKLLEISSSHSKVISYSKENGKKTIDIAKKKDTGCGFINSDVPPTTCSLNEQLPKSYRGIAEIDADGVERFKISKAHEINANPEKDMSTQIPKKKPLQNGKKVIILGDSMLRHQKLHIPRRAVIK